MNSPLFSFVRRCSDSLCQSVNRCLRRCTKPSNHTLLLNIAIDLTRSKADLVLENAFLRQQLIVLKRQGKRPTLTQRDRVLFVLLANKLRSWKQVVVIVQPDTLLRWHRDLFGRLWKRKSRSKGTGGRPPLSKKVVALIKQMRETTSPGAQDAFAGNC